MRGNGALGLLNAAALCAPVTKRDLASRADWMELIASNPAMEWESALRRIVSLRVGRGQLLFKLEERPRDLTFERHPPPRVRAIELG